MTARVVIVGAGVAGLTTAYRLLRSEPSLEVEILEAAPEVGGRLSTAVVGGLELDAGPDCFVARKPRVIELCRELGLELVEPAARGAFVWTERGLISLPPSALGVPTDADDLLRWPGLSRSGRTRALSDLVRKARPREEDESLGALLRRRLGDEATEILVAPLLGGLFAGEVDRLGVAATFPELAGWERDFGSLIRGAKASAKAAREAGPMFLRPVGGTRRLIDALVEAVGVERICTSTSVTGLGLEGERSVVRADDGAARSADAVVVATPAFVAADLVDEVAGDAARHLAAIPYVGTAVVLLVYPEGTAVALPEATGFVVPSGRAPMTAATFLSRKWPDPASRGRAVLRSFVGAAGSEDVLDAPAEDIVDAVCRHLAAALPLPERPEASHVVRWPRSMPQYEVGHLDRVAAIHETLPAGIVVGGNAYEGVGVADAVRSANEAAERVRAHLLGQQMGTERVG
jgi:oxygen-dependent protoporphyrinogen oxidase